MLGGLRPGTTEPMSAKSREEILHHWRDVHEMTGQAFTFEGVMPDGFVYDTEPPSRAVITVAELLPEAIFPYFKSVQEAFYTKQQDITHTRTLATLACGGTHGGCLTAASDRHSLNDAGGFPALTLPAAWSDQANPPGRTAACTAR